jgi:light-regulated signal transduction histidine kinase (bacteriophytochrome)
VHLIGSTPDAITVCGLAGLFGTRLAGFADGGGRVFATDALGDYAPISAEVKGIASGLLAAPLGDRGDMIMWFRRERVIDATWAGKPPTEAERNSEMMFRSRSDFAAHRAPLAGASRAWLEAEVLLAAQFAQAVSEQWQRYQRGTPATAPLPVAALPSLPAFAAHSEPAAFPQPSGFGDLPQPTAPLSRDAAVVSRLTFVG